MNFVPAIVAIAYDRPGSLSRLLASLAKADYPSGVSVPLVISIDKSDSDDVVKVAKEFNWEHGQKVVIERNPRMGLKQHVLTCGDLTEEYGSIIVLEDDLFVSPSFYEYSLKALRFTEGDERVGAISLYNHLFNVHARKSFIAIDDGYDNWYFQMASSWGQAYSKSQWTRFREWYDINKDVDLHKTEIPANISGWSDKSWLKYYIAYLIDTDKYAFYPRISYTTNFGDVGSHAVKADADLQVPLCGRVKKLEVNFSTVEQSEAVYDAFFENTRVRSGAIVDLYGMKPVERMVRENNANKENKEIKEVISSQSLPYECIKTYGKQMRPVDANIVYEVSGKELFLYDVTKTGKAPEKTEEAIDYLYEYRGISASQMISIIKYRIKEKLSSK